MMYIPTAARAGSDAAARPTLQRRIGRVRGALRGAFMAAALCAPPCTAMSAATPHTLGSYDALLAALQAGQPVWTMLDLAQCKREGSDAVGPHVQGGARITRFIIPNGQYLAFADTHLTLDTEDRPVTEYIRYRAMPDGSVTVRFATLSSGSSDVTPRGKFRCQFDRGIRFVIPAPPPAAPASQGWGFAPIRTPAPGTVEPPPPDASASGTGGAVPIQAAAKDGGGDTHHAGNGGDLDQ